MLGVPPGLQAGTVSTLRIEMRVLLARLNRAFSSYWWSPLLFALLCAAFALAIILIAQLITHKGLNW